MVCYCEKRKILYIHNPKTGGMTIEKILIEQYGFKNFSFDSGAYEFLNKKEGQNGFFKYILNHSKESKEMDLISFIKFTFVRHPHSRAASGLRYLSEKISESNGDFYDNFYDFYIACHEIPFFNIHFIMSQSIVLKDLNDEIKMDYIGKFEDFKNELERILFQELKLPPKDISKYHIHKTDPSLIEFDFDLIKRLSNIIHNEDFIEFGYLK